jgi:hypothetical protein
MAVGARWGTGGGGRMVVGAVAGCLVAVMLLVSAAECLLR